MRRWFCRVLDIMFNRSLFGDGPSPEAQGWQSSFSSAVLDDADDDDDDEVVACFAFSLD